MRRILVDRARSRGREKRGGGWEKVPLDQILLLGTKNADEALLDLDRALSKFAEREPEKAQVVEMHFFGGLTRDECAEILGISPRTISRYWDYAQAWLHREIATTRPI
jgi:RNA polymerase sigma factor (TIGR02999 family)